MHVSPVDLFGAIEGGRRPAILDVRNADEHARWRIEGPGAFDVLNLPYFAFIEDEAASVSKVKAWKSDHPGDLVVVCAKGDSSAFVAGLLGTAGLPASNLEGGMMEWGAATVRKPLACRGPLRAWQVNRFGKGCLSYLLAVGNDALVVDPHRRIDDYRRALADLELRLRGVFDTHLHADHLSGAPALSQAERVPYFAHPLDFETAAFEYSPIQDRQVVALGGLRVVPISFLHAPGHTPGSSLLLVNDTFLLTGDALFIGSVGRPDLGGHAREWARDLHGTLASRIAALDGRIEVLPAHTSGAAEVRRDGTVTESLSTLRRTLPLLSLDESSFIEEVLAGVGPAPPAYETIRRLNLGRGQAAEEDRVELEIGKNECALARR
jgi:glyoxylase-like metal-dependent hydrolase (beta-lactamase superfamily II)